MLACVEGDEGTWGGVVVRGRGGKVTLTQVMLHKDKRMAKLDGDI